MIMGVNPSTGFEQVRPTDDEKAAWDAKRPRQAGHYPYRSRCMRCGTRIWHSGIGIGSHRRACKGTFDERVVWFHYHRDTADIAARAEADPAAWAAYVTWLKLTPDPLAVPGWRCRHQVIALIADDRIEVPS
jgi:hypothetical protein